MGRMEQKRKGRTKEEKGKEIEREQQNENAMATVYYVYSSKRYVYKR